MFDAGVSSCSGLREAITVPVAASTNCQAMLAGLPSGPTSFEVSRRAMRSTSVFACGAGPGSSAAAGGWRSGAAVGDGDGGASGKVLGAMVEAPPGRSRPVAAAMRPRSATPVRTSTATSTRDTPVAIQPATRDFGTPTSDTVS